MPKGYENKDKNNEVYKPSGLMPKNYANDHTYNNQPTTTTKKGVSSGTIAGLIVFILIVTIISVYAYLWSQADSETERMLQQGCTIVGTDWRGIATNFLCPPGVE
jgi:hypothetical protein